MFAVLLLIFLGIGAALAAAAIVDTWRQYGSAWDVLAQEMRYHDLAGAQDVRVKSKVVRLTYGSYAAA